MATTEHTINDALAEVLRGTRRAWSLSGAVRSENTGLFKGGSRQPDILILEPNVAPVVVETEVIPAATVEADARGRLGERLSSTGRPVWSSIAVRMPLILRSQSGSSLRQGVLTCDFEMVLFTGKEPEKASRWPEAGWLTGSITDLSVLAQSASLPPDMIIETAERLVVGVREASGILKEVCMSHPGAAARIASELRQEDDEQTRRMAMTILANAFVFHGSLARGLGDLGGVMTIGELRSLPEGLNQASILNEWHKILKVDYWPIFDIARRLLEVLPSAESRPLIESLAHTAEILMQSNLMRSHDLTGAVFQQLIADRKFLAAHYTTPASASLLVGLAINSGKTPARGDWGDIKHIKSLRIGDLACGTGTLLSTAYQRIGQLYEMHGGDSESVHTDMMANALIGCDVLPSAAHLTASMLAGAHPTMKCDDTLILTVGYGRQTDGGVALGSLELMDEQRRLPFVAITAKVSSGTGESEEELWSKLQHISFDLILMNPPFIRATDHSGKKAAVPIPMFGAFGSSAKDQQDMSKAIQCLFKSTSAHGNAGEASYFLPLADKKLKTGGTLGLVMPLSLVSGDAWEASRELLRKNYSEITIVSIAGGGHDDMSFSADTGMGECIVIARKEASEQSKATFVVLKERPLFPLVGANVARQICIARSTGCMRKLEDGPIGGSSISFGDDLIGHAIEAPLPENGPWNVARVWDLSLAQAAYQLANNDQVWLPGMSKPSNISTKINTIKNIGRVGPYHMDINDDTPTSTGGFRGPFEIKNRQPNFEATYPVLWAHEAKRERTLEFEPDSEGIIRSWQDKQGEAEIRNKAARIWATASHCHFNADFQFNAQSTAMQFTPRRSIGGRAWPSIILSSLEMEKTLVLWGNSTLGLLLRWWHSSKQQAGRGNIGISTLGSLPVLDVTSLSREQLKQSCAIFDDMKDKPLQPVNELATDTVRHEIDRRLAVEVLGFSAEFLDQEGPLDLLRQKLAREPSITGKQPVT